jgi:tetratricopeptide (TPR) repeat protein
MKPVFSVLYILFSFLYGGAQDISVVIKEADRLEAVPSEKAAFLKFKEALKIQPTNIYALSKCSELCSRIGQRETNTKLRDDYYKAAKIYAETALKIDPNSSDANCAMAIALGRSSMSKSGKEKILTAREIKKHLDISIKTNPQNFKAWHVLGRWHYEISNLNFAERAIVKVIYGGLPPATLAQSIHAFEKSKSITALFILNYYEMARAYKENDQKDKALASLRHMLTLPNQTEDDAAIKAKGKNLLKSWE